MDQELRAEMEKMKREIRKISRRRRRRRGSRDRRRRRSRSRSRSHSRSARRDHSRDRSCSKCQRSYNRSRSDDRDEEDYDHPENDTEAAALSEPAALTNPADQTNPATSTELAALTEPAALPSEIEDILGKEGLQDQTKGISLHPRIETRWAAILTSGLSEQSRQSIAKKYTLPENCPLLKPPILNEEVAATMNESGLKRDKRIAEKQMALSTAVSCIGQVLNTMLENDSSCLKQIETLNDAARMMCSIIQSDSVTRRTLILPGLNKDMKALMEKTEISEFLFGDRLQDKVSACKAMKKSAQELKNTPATQTTKKALNFRGPPKQTPHLSGPKEKKTPRRPPFHRVQAPPTQRHRSPQKQSHQRRRPGHYRR